MDENESFVYIIETPAKTPESEMAKMLNDAAQRWNDTYIAYGGTGLKIDAVGQRLKAPPCTEQLHRQCAAIQEKVFLLLLKLVPLQSDDPTILQNMRRDYLAENDVDE